jgi:hypothetical protein
VTSVQSPIVVTPASPPTVTFQTNLVTLRMLSSTGAGLAGQDELMWVREFGTVSYFVTGVPSSGVGSQELLAGRYDFKARWFGVSATQANVNVSGPVTVTFTSMPVTLRMFTSTGSPLTGQDEQMWVRQAGTSTYFNLGTPPATGVIVQELFAAAYDARFKWTGTFATLGSNAVSGPTTITMTAVAVVMTCRRQSDNTVVSGANGYVVTSPNSYLLGITDASGVVTLQVFAGAHDFKCRLGTLIGTNTNVNVPAGGASTTVLIS